MLQVENRHKKIYIYKDKSEKLKKKNMCRL